MSYMLLILEQPGDRAARLPGEGRERYERMMAYAADLRARGVLLAGESLASDNEGTRMVMRQGRQTLIDGPFAETRELVAGFWVWEVKDMAEAIEWAKRCPNPMPGPSELEIRPFYEMADFADVVTPEIVERDGRLRDQLKKR